MRTREKEREKIFLLCHAANRIIFTVFPLFSVKLLDYRKLYTVKWTLISEQIAREFLSREKLSRNGRFFFSAHVVGIYSRARARADIWLETKLKRKNFEKENGEDIVAHQFYILKKFRCPARPSSIIHGPVKA